MIVLGIDGGGSRTRAVLVNESGTVLGRGISGPSNFHAAGLSSASETIRHAVSQAFESGTIPVQPCAAAFLGMAGVRTDSERALIHDMAVKLQLAPAEKIQIDHDIRIAHAAGLSGREGIALIAGTGSACYGRCEDGRHWQAGGWGRILDDPGSGHDISRRALSAVVRAEDGRGDATLLAVILLDALKLTEARAIVHRLHGSGPFRDNPLSGSELAALAPLVLKAAEDDDSTAVEIVGDGIAELVLMVQTVNAKLLFSAPRVALSGGLMNAAYFKKKLSAAIVRRVCGSQIVETNVEPVFGAAILALKSLGCAT